MAELIAEGDGLDGKQIVLWLKRCSLWPRSWEGVRVGFWEGYRDLGVGNNSAIVVQALNAWQVLGRGRAE